MPHKEITILLADDHPMIRKGMIAMLQNIGIGKLFFEADDGEQALKIFNQHSIDLFLLDYKMHGMSGIDLTRKILRKKPASKIMIISSYAQPELVMQFYRAGVKGYLEKDCDLVEIKKALSQVIAGKMYYHPSLRILPLKKEVHKRKKAHTIIEFTTREKDLVTMIAKGLSSQEIADIKELSVRTIETNRSRLLKKVGVKNTAELLDYFYRNGLF